MLKVRFKPVRFSDLELLRKWRNTPRISQNMYSSEHITTKQQEKWFESLIVDKTRKVFICLLNDTPVGTLYFSSIESESCEWGCYLGGEALLPGVGLILEASALNYAFKYLHVNTLMADVLSFNEPPKKMHKLFKYHDLGKYKTGIIRDGIELEVNKYQYRQEDWNINKAGVYKILPKKITEIINNVDFT